jgi:hypothetical protein
MLSVPPVGPYAQKLPAETSRNNHQCTDVHDDMRSDCIKCSENESKGAGICCVECIISGSDWYTMLNGSSVEVTDILCWMDHQWNWLICWVEWIISWNDWYIMLNGLSVKLADMLCWMDHQWNWLICCVEWIISGTDWNTMLNGSSVELIDMLCWMDHPWNWLILKHNKRAVRDGRTGRRWGWKRGTSGTYVSTGVGGREAG